MRSTRLTIGLCLAAQGCAGYRMGSAGVWQGVGDGAHGLGVAVDVEQAQSFGAAGRGNFLLWSLGAHGKFSASRAQVAPTLGLRLMPLRGGVIPFAGVGIRLLQVELIGGAAGFGMFSPVADAGLMVLIPGRSAGTGVGGFQVVGGWAVVLRGAAGYDLRFSAQPHEPWVSATLGVGVVFGAH